MPPTWHGHWPGRQPSLVSQHAGGTIQTQSTGKALARVWSTRIWAQGHRMIDAELSMLMYYMSTTIWAADSTCDASEITPCWAMFQRPGQYPPSPRGSMESPWAPQSIRYLGPNLSSTALARGHALRGHSSFGRLLASHARGAGIHAQ